MIGEISSKCNVNLYDDYDKIIENKMKKIKKKQKILVLLFLVEQW